MSYIEQPAGFENHSGAVSHDFDVTPTLIGVFVRTVEKVDKKGKPFTLHIFNTETGIRSIPEYGHIKDFLMSLEAGDQIVIHYTGELIETPQAPMRVFQTFVKKIK